MEFSEVIATRRSVRGFADRPVEDEKLAHVLEAARSAPSWGNKQCVRFVVVRDRAAIRVVGKPTGGINKWLPAAPAIIVVCGERARSGVHHSVEFWAVDAAIAGQTLALAAVDAGLGTCWIGGFDEPEVRATLRIPDEIGILALLPIGYPAERMGAGERLTRTAVRANTRKPITEFVHWDRW